MTATVEPTPAGVTAAPLGDPDRRVPTAPRSLHWTDRLRWVLGVGWIALLGWTLVAGAQPSRWDALLAGVDSGQVSRVVVNGPASPDGGTARQEVVWREGFFHRRAEVTWAAAGVSTTSSSDTTGQAVPVLRSDPAAALTALHPGLVVERGDTGWIGSSRWLGWWLPISPLVSGAVVGGALLTLYLVMNVPAPWRLTRWAWFWIAFTPVGVLLFALFAGPAPLLPAPSRPERRLTGGRAFLLSLLLAPLLKWGAQG